jgi:hypothetical protein
MESDEGSEGASDSEGESACDSVRPAPHTDESESNEEEPPFPADLGPEEVTDSFGS